MLAVEAAPDKRRTVAGFDDPAVLAEWATRMARMLDADLPATTAGVTGVVTRALVENAQQHGAPPVIVEVSVSTVVTIEVTDHGAGRPIARPDGTGSLAVVIDRFASLWDVTEHEDGSKTVTALLPIEEDQPCRPRRRVKR
jgi:hypothetical protein